MLIQIYTEQLRKLLKILFLVFFILFILNAVAISAADLTGHSRMLGFFNWFYFDGEGNFPTYFSVFNLLLASSILYVIYQYHKENHTKGNQYWLFFSIAILCLSLDDFIQVHETATMFLHEYIPTGGWLYYTWVIPGLFILLVAVLFFGRFFWSLPERNKKLLGSSLGLFFLGAIGMELISGRFAPNLGEFTLNSALMATVEQSMQWIGELMILFSLIDYMQSNILTVRLLPEVKRRGVKHLSWWSPGVAISKLFQAVFH